MAQEVAFPTSFAKGELTPALSARVDLSAYHVGAAKLRNFFVNATGGASTRPGTQFLGSFNTTDVLRLIPFIFSTVQAYVLVLSNLKARVLMNGGFVLEANKTITNITQANPAVVTSNGHGFANGDIVWITGVNGMLNVNNRFFIVAGQTANTFQLHENDGSNVSSISYLAYTSGGTVARQYSFVTPWAAADLPLLKFTQSADTLTVCHPSYAPRDVTRSGHTNWTVTTVTFGAVTAAPTGLVATPSNVGTTHYKYVVTAISADGKEESRASSSADGASVELGTGSVPASMQLTWNAVGGASRYNIYRQPGVVGGTPSAGDLFGYIGSASANSFDDTNILPDFTRVPPQAQNPFAAGNNPACVTYFQQRKVFAGSTLNPETVWMSQVGNYKNFDTSTPSKASDAITIAIASQQVNAINALVPMSFGLLALTDSSAVQISGGASAAPLTPTTVQAQPQAYNGTTDVPPVVINYDIIYVQARGSAARDLAYNFYVNIYTGNDISILSQHLLIGKTIREWAWAEEPFKLLWVVRSDGAMLSLTYLKEQEVLAWCPHQTGQDQSDKFKSVATIPEGSENAVYVVVERSAPGRNGGAPMMFVERLHSRDMTRAWLNYDSDVCAAWCTDSAVSRGRSTPAATLTVTGLTNIGTEDDPLYTGIATLTASAAVFTAQDIGNIVRCHKGVLHVTGFTSATVVTAAVDAGLDDLTPVKTGDWYYTAPITTLYGLDHLEGEEVQILAAGNVEDPKVVTNGQVSWSTPADIVTVGLPYECQLQTMRIDLGQPTVQGKMKTIPAVTVRVQDTRGLRVGPTFDDMWLMKERSTEPMGQPVQLITGDELITIGSRYMTEGQICIEQDFPLPATVLGCFPSVSIGDTP
jgi:hypothetical protein